MLETADTPDVNAGETAIRGSELVGIDLADGHGIDIALLIDTCRWLGIDATAEVDVRERVQRNRPLHERSVHADAVLKAVLSRQSNLQEEARC